MSDLALFTYDGHQVRTITINGEPWFVVTDVARILGYRDAGNASRLLRDHQQGYSEVSTPGGPQRMRVCSEQGLYRLILRSNASNADAVQDWVTDEVLPQIRRTGAYVPAQRTELTRLELIEIARAAELERLALTERVAELEPSAHAWDTLASADGDYSVREAAYILNRDPAISTGQRRLFTHLRALGVIGPGDIPYAAHEAHVRLRPRAYTDPATGEQVPAQPQVRVTAQGLRYLYRQLGGAAALDTTALPDYVRGERQPERARI